jgi:hypothetical protein
MKMHAATSKYALVGALLALAPALGLAQGQPPAQDLTPFGEYVLVGGGVTDFAKEAVKDRYDVGGTWDARIGFGNRFYVGGEIAYVGSARGATGSGSDLMSNGAEGVVRVQYPYATGDWLVEPFAFGGLGWSHVSLKDAAPGLKSSDEIGVVPFGAGVTLGYKQFLLDARFTYRATFSDDLALAVNSSPASLDQWGVVASVGYEF